MAQITSLYVYKVVSQASPGVETRDLIRELGLPVDGTIDPAQMVSSSAYYDFFAELVDRDPSGLVLPLRIGAAMRNMVLNGAITLPAGDQVEPFVDVDDIADVANDLSRATGREISFIDVPHKSFISEMENSGPPEDVVWMLDYLFATVLDGRNAHLTQGVQQALGRPPKDFAVFAEEVAKTGIWEGR